MQPWSYGCRRVWRVFRVKNKCIVTTQTELPNKWLSVCDLFWRALLRWNPFVLSWLSNPHFLLELIWEWFTWCIITLIWNLFACFLWNQIKQFLKYDFLNSPASLLKSLFCMLTCEGLFDNQFRKYVFFLNHHYFWNLFAFLLRAAFRKYRPTVGTSSKFDFAHFWLIDNL